MTYDPTEAEEYEYDGPPTPHINDAHIYSLGDRLDELRQDFDRVEKWKLEPEEEISLLNELLKELDILLEGEEIKDKLHKKDYGAKIESLQVSFKARIDSFGESSEEEDSGTEDEDDADEDDVDEVGGSHGPRFTRAEVR